MKNNEYYTNCVCILALGIQHAMRIRHIFVCDLLRSSTLFSKLSHRRHDFRKKNVIKHKLYFKFLFKVC